MQKLAYFLIPLITIISLTDSWAQAQGWSTKHPSRQMVKSTTQTHNTNKYPPKTTIGFSVHVPTMRHMEIHITPTTPRKWYSQEEKVQEINRAIHFILNLRHHQELQTKQDAHLFQLLEAYQKGHKKITITEAPEFVRDFVRMGYSCENDTYITGSWYMPTPLLALTLYHEITHELTCENLLEFSGIRSRAELKPGFMKNMNICNIEAPAHASSIRLFLAMFNSNLLPKEIPMSKQTGDPIKTLHDSWEALLRGRNGFCQYLEHLYREIPTL